MGKCAITIRRGMQNAKIQMEAEFSESQNKSGEGMKMNRVAEEEGSEETYASEGKKEEG